jgi:hypothetical protein
MSEKSYWTGPQLFAGRKESGPAICFYCAGRCKEKNASKDIVKSSFTGLDTVTLSSWVCDGCIVAMDERATIQLIDGEVRHGQKTRLYTYIFNEHWKRGATKAHREEILIMCLSPPEPPFVISLAESGQKHLLYRSVVNYSCDSITVTLEGVPIHYTPSALRDRLELTKRVCAATGKPALKEAMSFNTQMRVCEYYEDESVLMQWLKVCGEPLTQLAIWLCPPKEICENEFKPV